MVSLRWTVNNITIEINCERDLEPTHSTLMFAQKQFLGIRKLWLAINSFLYSPDYLYVVISLCYCMLFLLRLHQHCQCPVCSVTSLDTCYLSRTITSHCFCNPAASHWQDMVCLWKELLGFYGWSKLAGRRKGSKAAHLLCGCCCGHSSLCEGHSWVRSEQNMFVSYFTPVSLSRNMGIIRRFKSSANNSSLYCSSCVLCVSLQTPQSNLFKPLIANDQANPDVWQ